MRNPSIKSAYSILKNVLSDSFYDDASCYIFRTVLDLSLEAVTSKNPPPADKAAITAPELLQNPKIRNCVS